MTGLLDLLGTAWWLLATVPKLAAILLAAGAIPAFVAGWVAACIRHQRHRRALTHALHRAQRDAADWRRAGIHAVADHADRGEDRGTDRDADRGRVR